jgi:hypothetical protein
MKTTQILKYIETTETDYFFEIEVMIFGMISMQLKKKNVTITEGVKLKTGVLYCVEGDKDFREFGFMMHPPFTVLSEADKDTAAHYETTLSLIK